MRSPHAAPETGTAAADRISALDGFRALAILLVAGFHYTSRFPTPDLPAKSPFRGFLPFEYGWMGVELFFVISGFVILMTLQRSHGLVDFACRRFARLWPPLIGAAILTTAVTWLLGPSEWRVSPLDFACSILLVDPKFVSLFATGGSVKWVDPVYWSLGVELRFYVVAGTVYALSKGRFVPCWIALQASVALSGALSLPQGPDTAVTIALFPKYMPYFTLGICVFEIWSKGESKVWAIFGIGLAFQLIMMDSALSLDLFAGRSPSVSVIANLLIFTLFGLFLLGNRLMALFQMRPLVALGRASYSFYLLHNVIGLCIMREMILMGVPYPIVLPLTLCACITASLLTFRWV